MKLLNKITFILNEDKMITVYHGDNHNTKKLEIEKMFMGGNQQEGVGIYFGSSVDVAKDYGKNIIVAKINPKNFIYSRDEIGKFINKSTLEKILIELNKVDNEEFYYLITDYGVELTEPTKNVDKKDMDILINKISKEQVRNFQIDMCQRFGVKSFVKLWNNYTKIQGTYNKEGFYAIIDPTIKVSPY